MAKSAKARRRADPSVIIGTAIGLALAAAYLGGIAWVASLLPAAFRLADLSRRLGTLRRLGASAWSALCSTFWTACDDSR